MVSHDRVEARADAGLVGDRYFVDKNRRGPDYQLSLIEIENIEAFGVHTGVRLAPDAPRRNIVTSGVRLNDLCGQRFRIGSVVLEGLELCEPCRLFKSRTDPRVIEFFVSKGGLRTRVLIGGMLDVGASIETVV
jgi:MOSC domain-containing protein YiiM